MKKRHFVVLMILAVLPACGGGAGAYQYSDEVEPTLDEDIRLSQEQAAAEERLNEVLARPEPDCEAACDLGTSICDLSTRICTIAARNAGRSEIAGRCEDATARCDSARTRIAERCTCGS